MASIVKSGEGNFTYTNNTGQNVRLVINYMASGIGGENFFNMSWSKSDSPDITGIEVYAPEIGRTLNSSYFTTFRDLYQFYENRGNNIFQSFYAPTEIMLAPGQTFFTAAPSLTYPLGPYNIVIIPEAG
jgi:hypothetical protein